MLEYISIDRLQGHPKNPRLSVGDITELADSIKEQGVLQNLTVVPNGENKYTVIIGHRRLEASKLAGLKQVPCAIVEMDEKTQVSSMLVENMQRSDLTPYEEAQGIQKCLDLGMTDDDIHKKTRLSKSKIQNRKQLLKLDVEKVQTAMSLSIDDFINLERIEDIDKRNALLEHAGTNDFNIKVEQDYRLQERDKRTAIIMKRIKELELYKVDDTNWNTHDRLASFRTDNDEEMANVLEVLNSLDENETYVYHETNYGDALYRVKKDKPKNSKESAEEENEREQRRIARRKRKELKPIFASAYQLRYDFVKSLVKGKLTEAITKHITSTIAENMILSHRSFEPKHTEINELLEYDVTQAKGDSYYERELTKRSTREVSNVRKYNIMVSAIYLSIDHEELNCYGHQGEYNDYSAKQIKNVYDFLKGLGYKISDIEKGLIEGTHELYYVEKKEEPKIKKHQNKKANKTIGK